MSARLYPLLVLLFWLASMTWLTVEKILPPLLGGTPPDYDAVLSQRQPEPDLWKIFWNNRPIGLAASQVIPQPGGVRELRSAVKFENLSLDALISQVLGVWTRLVRTMLGTDGEARITAVIATRAWFDPAGQFTGFQTILGMDERQVLLVVRGQRGGEGKLVVTAEVPSGGAADAGGGTLFRQELEVPPNALVSDAFTPRGALKNLRIGQSWTIPVYRPFPPNSPVQIVAVKVERHEVIIWDGNDVETMLLVYRTDAGSGIGAVREPVAREWVRRDGVVLCQELELSGLRLKFERLPNAEDNPEQNPLAAEDPRKDLLDDRKHPQLWGRLGDSRVEPAATLPPRPGQP